MAILIIRDGAGKSGRIIGLKPGPNRFGRGPDNDYMLADARVAEHHCEITVDGNLVHVRDLGSATGTFVNGQRVADSPLQHGWLLRIGPLECEVDAPLPDDSAADSEAETESVLPRHRPAVGDPLRFKSDFRRYRKDKPLPVLPDGEPGCVNHTLRHALWSCPECRRFFCDDCVRKVQRVGCAWMTLCLACTKECVLTAWGVRMREKKPGLLQQLVARIRPPQPAAEPGPESPGVGTEVGGKPNLRSGGAAEGG